MLTRSSTIRRGGYTQGMGPRYDAERTVIPGGALRRWFENGHFDELDGCAPRRSKSLKSPYPL